MPKGSSTRGNANSSLIANRQVVGPYSPASSPSISSTLSLLHAMQAQAAHEAAKVYKHPPVGDRRRYTPNKHYGPPHSFIRAATRLEIGRAARSVSRGRQPRVEKIAFAVPRAVSLCIRRKVRREVYLALTHKKARGSSASRRRNYWSDIKC